MPKLKLENLSIVIQIIKAKGGISLDLMVAVEMFFHHFNVIKSN